MDRILAVDDDQNTLHAVKRIFAREDYELALAKDGEEAMRLIPEFMPALVTLDVMMPGLDGYEVCRRLKADAGTSGIMVLIVSAKIFVEDRLKGYEAGADDYITKPYDPEELKAKVRILLRLKNAQDELRRLNQDLEHLIEMRTRELVQKERQAAVGQMVQGIVHNIRGPLTVIRGRADISLMAAREVRKKCNDDFDNRQKAVEKLIQHLDSLVDATGRAEQLVENLLVKGRHESTEKREWLNLNEVIAREVKFLDADMFLKHDIRKHLDLDSSLPEFYGVYSDFSQIIYNLVRNAADAMASSDVKSLVIGTRHDDRGVYFSVRDTGAGISPEDRPRIFDPFFTTKWGKDPDKGGNDLTGTGLGLYTCAQLLKAYRGEISVESTLGIGSAFTVMIPKQTPPSPGDTA
ncbi:MAG: hybrid sensor histidine kinase/response regulator [Pseudomonadota bacterium]